MWCKTRPFTVRKATLSDIKRYVHHVTWVSVKGIGDIQPVKENIYIGETSKLFSNGKRRGGGLTLNPSAKERLIRGSRDENLTLIV